MDDKNVDADEALYEVLSIFSQAAATVGAKWLIIGATARILLLEKVYGMSQGRGTQDVDFGVQIGDWDHYGRLCQLLIENDVFETERSPTKRFRSKKDMVFDLVPYGGVEDEKSQVFWPSHNDDVMTVRGFSSAANDAIEVLVNTELTVPVASPRGLCALKLFAWEERHSQHPGRDAQDIAYFIQHIESLYPTDKLHNDYPKAIEVADYQIQYAGMYQLGSDMKDLLVNEEKIFLAEFISKELDQKEDSLLCRELHHYANLSVEEIMVALDYLYKGLSR